MGHILYLRVCLKDIEDCKVVTKESLVRQHRMVVCRMTLEIKKRRRERGQNQGSNGGSWKRKSVRWGFKDELR